jgi:hypothetical protein
MFIVPTLGFVLASALASIHVVASPTSPTILERAACTPNFWGRRQSIFRVTGRGYGVQWIPDVRSGGTVTLGGESLGSLVNYGEFTVPFTGQPNGSFQIRFIDLHMSLNELLTSIQGQPLIPLVLLRWPERLEEVLLSSPFSIASRSTFLIIQRELPEYTDLHLSQQSRICDFLPDLRVA